MRADHRKDRLKLPPNCQYQRHMSISGIIVSASRDTFVVRFLERLRHLRRHIVLIMLSPALRRPQNTIRPHATLGNHPCPSWNRSGRIPVYSTFTRFALSVTTKSDRQLLSPLQTAALRAASR